jgi:hypothetical protein
MYLRDYRDVVSGAVLTFFGIWFARYAIVHYGAGTAVNVGDGLFPAALGVALATLGVLVLIGGLLRTGTKLEYHFRAPFFVLVGVAGFSIVITYFGVVPAILALVIFSSLADKRVYLGGLVILCVVLCMMAFLIFKLGLGLALPMFTWPL